MKRNRFFAGLLALLLLPFFGSGGSGCNSGTLFQTITTEFSYPIAVAVDPVRNRAYVVNSNNNFKFTSTTLSVLDVTDPANPVLFSHASNPIPIPNFSGQIYLDTVNPFAYVPNRFSEDSQDTTDSLLRIDIDESSSSFGHYDPLEDGENPFGIGCCDASGRIYVVSSGGNGNGTVDIYDPAASSESMTSIRLSLAVTLASGENFLGKNSTEVALLGDQAFVTNRSGRLYAVNTTEVGDEAKNPVDSIVLNGGDFRGITTDGTLLYVVDGKSDTLLLRVLDPSKMPAVSPDASTTTELDIGAVQTASYALGKDPNEVIVFKDKAYVTNRGDDTVTVVDLSAKKIMEVIAVGDEPFGLAAFTSTADSKDYLYVTNLISNSMSVIDLSANNTVVNTFAP